MSSTELRTRLRNALRGEAYMEELFATIYGTTGSVFYVDSVSGNASWNGLSSNRAITTLDAAVALCTANKGDIIFLMPGHKEDIGNAQIDLDVAGISVIGLGHGTARPQFTYDHANASIDIGANGVVVRNIVLYPSVTDVLVGIDIETTVTDTLLEDIEAIPGEDGAGVDDFDKVVELKATCTRTTIRRLKVRQHASGAGYIAGIHLNDASDDVLIEDCDIYILGAGVIAPINGITTLSTNLRIRGCTLMTDAEPGIELVTGTTGILQNNHIFTDLATIDAAVVADTMAAFENYYVEVGPESGALIGTPSVDD